MEETCETLNNLKIEDEEWRDLINYPGYKASSLGRIKTPKNNISNAQPRKSDGYIQVSIKKLGDSRGKMVNLHRLIAEAFIPNPENKLEVNHINGLRYDNKVSNLEWATRHENCNNKVFAKFVPTNRKLIQYTLNNEIIKEWDSVKAVLEHYKYSIKKFRDCCHGKTNSYGGFKWKYYDEALKIEGEKWKELDFNGKTIEISSAGRIKGPSRRITFGAVQDNEQHEENGYRYYSSERVHRLVMLAFVPNENADSLFVDHIDGNKSNNNLSNLRWVTPSENSQHAHNMKKFVNNGHTKKVNKYTLEGEFIETFNSIKEAAISINVSGYAITGAIKRREKGTSGGFKWKFA